MGGVGRKESTEADKLAQEAFSHIRRYMGDEGVKRGHSLTDCVYEILSIANRYELMRDEVYCQLVKQLTSNNQTTNPESVVKGWGLMGIVTAYFVPSPMLHPYLVKWLRNQESALDGRRSSSEAARQCIHNLSQTYRYGGRRLALGTAEAEAISLGRNVKLQYYHYPGGHKKVVPTRSATVVQQVVQELCREMNVRSGEEQEQFSLCYILEDEGVIRSLRNDEYVMDVIAKLDSRKEARARSNNSVRSGYAEGDYLLTLIRAVWLTPLRADSRLYADVLFYQTVPNYLSGLLTPFGKGGELCLLQSCDLAVLGACLLLSDPNWSGADMMTAHSVETVLPKTLLQHVRLPPQQWVERLRNKLAGVLSRICRMDSASRVLSARLYFLSVIKHWPLYGAQFYPHGTSTAGRAICKQQCGNSGHEIADCVLALNANGFRLLSGDSAKEQLIHHALDEIESVRHYTLSTSDRCFVEISLKSKAAERSHYIVLTIETDASKEIVRLYDQYIYLCGRADGVESRTYAPNKLTCHALFDY